jgi:hypothetical protein
MTRILDLLFTARENSEAVEGYCTVDSQPKPAEICSHTIGSKEHYFQCVFVNPINENVYFCRFEKLDKNLVF